MEEKRYNVTAVEDRLNSYRENARDIDNEIERLERLISKMSGVGAQVISDMPRAPGYAGDRISAMVAEKEELDEKIRTEIQEQADEWKSIEGLLANLKHSDEKAVIRMRYHDRESWGMVTRLMFGSKDDFVGKEDTYLRRVHKIHGSALLNMAKLLEDGDPNTAVPAAI